MTGKGNVARPLGACVVALVAMASAGAQATDIWVPRDLINANSGLCLEAGGPNDVELKQCNGSANQRWGWSEADGKLRNVGTSRCLDVFVENGLFTRDCNDPLARAWSVRGPTMSDPYLKIVSWFGGNAVERCLAGSGNIGYVAVCENLANQKWFSTPF